MCVQISIYGRKDQVKIVGLMMHNLSPEEQRWMIRIILKGICLQVSNNSSMETQMIFSCHIDLKAGVREKTVLSAFHPQAIELFNVSSDLKRVCWTLADRHARLDEKVSSHHSPIGMTLAS
jgi:DNA ligase-4